MTRFTLDIWKDIYFTESWYFYRTIDRLRCRASLHGISCTTTSINTHYHCFHQQHIRSNFFTSASLALRARKAKSWMVSWAKSRPLLSDSTVATRNEDWTSGSTGYPSPHPSCSRIFNPGGLESKSTPWICIISPQYSSVRQSRCFVPTISKIVCTWKVAVDLRRMDASASPSDERGQWTFQTKKSTCRQVFATRESCQKHDWSFHMKICKGLYIGKNIQRQLVG